MSPYLNYGYGFKPKDLPEEVKERLEEEMDCFEMFTEEYDQNMGIFYILKSSPFDDNREYDGEVTTPWSCNFDGLLSFQENNKHKIEDALENFDLLEYKHLVSFYVSCTEA
jgi:hypothetical protein